MDKVGVRRARLRGKGHGQDRSPGLADVPNLVHGRGCARDPNPNRNHRAPNLDLARKHPRTAVEAIPSPLETPYQHLLMSL